MAAGGTFMRILELEQKPIYRLRYTNAAKRGGVESAALDVLRARVEGLPPELGGLVATSDLQGVVTRWELGGETCLLGEHFPDVFAELADGGIVPNPATLGAILAGDLFSAPGGDKRGATGDVRSVWQAFASAFSWVAGVAGNHDLFGTEREQRRFSAQSGIHLLDCDSVDLQGLRVAGVGYIIGDPERVGRRELGDYIASLELVLQQRPDLLVLHGGPAGDRTQRGSTEIRDVLLGFPPLLVVCGHAHWDFPLAELDNGAQVLNVDARAVVLSR